MEDSFATMVYDTMTGMLDGEWAVTGIENAFKENAKCDRLYGEVFQANIRLCKRLGSGEDDADVECIINNMLEIQRELCIRMYNAGVQFGGIKI